MPQRIAFKMFCNCGPGQTWHEVWGHRTWRRVFTKTAYAESRAANRCSECQKIWPATPYRKPKSAQAGAPGGQP